MLVLGLLIVEEHKNTQIKCIGQLLTVLSISSTVSSTPIYQHFALNVASFLRKGRSLWTQSLFALFLYMLRLWRFRQLERVHSFF